MANKHPVGTEVRYFHEDAEHRAQIQEVHPETGEVLGLTIYDAAGNIVGGIRDPKPATKPEHHITNGHFRKLS